MYLSYSGLKRYQECHFAYWLQYCLRISIEEPEDRLGALYGATVGVLFERFYRDRLWRDPSTVREKMLSSVDGILREVTQDQLKASDYRSAGVLRWKGSGTGQNPKALYSSREELVEDIQAAVDRGLATIRHYRLLGAFAEAEVKLDRMVNSHKLGGRSDFIIHRTKPHLDWVILDGKGSQHRGKYTDPQQLLWYGVLYRLAYGRSPDKMGFLYWRSKPPESIDWLDYSDDSLDDFLKEILRTIQEIESLSEKVSSVDPSEGRRVFKPRPDFGSCRFCPYATETLCPVGSELMQSKQRR